MDGTDEFDSLKDLEDRRRPPLEGIVERREHPRYALDAWAEVMVKDGTLLFRGRVLDISIGGCYIETEARLRLAPGAPVEMIFRVDGMVFRCEAAARMVRTRGAGFLFAPASPKLQQDLEALIRRLGGEGD